LQLLDIIQGITSAFPGLFIRLPRSRVDGRLLEHGQRLQPGKRADGVLIERVEQRYDLVIGESVQQIPDPVQRQVGILEKLDQTQAVQVFIGKHRVFTVNFGLGEQSFMDIVPDGAC